MEQGSPSRTAFGAATHRAVHQLVDRPALLVDPYALSIVAPDPKTMPTEALLSEHAASTTTLRAQIVGRTLYAEDALASAVGRGVDQYVVLGAGLDTFAYRNPWPNLRVYEVDHPATGAWKQSRLAEARISVPTNVAYAAIDFERDTLAEALSRAGFNLSRPAVFAWLGVSVYLSKEAILATLRAAASMAPGTDLVFDYAEPRTRLPQHIQERLQARMDQLAAIGEPWISFFDPSDMAEMLAVSGLPIFEDINGPQINARYFANRSDNLCVWPLSHFVRASVA